MSKVFSKKIKLKVVAISLATQEDRYKLGINDGRVPVYKAGLEVDTVSKDFNFFPFLSSHVTALLLDHPNIGETFTLIFEKERSKE